MTSNLVVVALTAFLLGATVGAIAFLTIAVALLERATRVVSVAAPAGDRLPVEESGTMADEVRRDARRGASFPADLPTYNVTEGSPEAAPAASAARYNALAALQAKKQCSFCAQLRALFSRPRAPEVPPSGS